MQTDFESNQSVEVIGLEDTYNETFFKVGLYCTERSRPGHFDPRWGGEPPSGPEFEVTTITVDVPRVNYKGEVEGYEDPLVLTYRQLEALVGVEAADKLVGNAIQAACDSGEF